MKSRSKRRLAFTLVELLLALALLSVVAGIAVPAYFNGFQEHRVIDQAVATTMESLLTAKEMAVRTSTPHVCQYETKSNSQIVFPVNDRSARKVFTLPETVHLEAIDRESIEQLQVVDQLRVTFRSDGSTDNYSLKIKSPTQTKIIRIDRRLGVPRVSH